MLQDLDHEPVQLRDYIMGEFRARYAGDPSVTKSLVWDFAGRRYTSAADLAFTVKLAHRPETRDRGVAPRFARDVRPEDTNGVNLILLGPRHMNPWVELFEKEATFRLEHNESDSTYRLVNAKPAPGEPNDVLVSPMDVRREILGIVNYHRSHEGSSVLMLSGTGVAGAEAASDFVSDDAKLAPVLQKAAKDGRIRGFDLLLRGRNLAGSSPRASVVAMHIDEYRAMLMHRGGDYPTYTQHCRANHDCSRNTSLFRHLLPNVEWRELHRQCAGREENGDTQGGENQGVQRREIRHRPTLRGLPAGPQALLE
jgi:hypothetical protein